MSPVQVVAKRSEDEHCRPSTAVPNRVQKSEAGLHQVASVVPEYDRKNAVEPLSSLMTSQLLHAVTTPALGHCDS